MIDRLQMLTLLTEADPSLASVVTAWRGVAWRQEWRDEDPPPVFLVLTDIART